MRLRAWWARLKGSLRRGDALEKEVEREIAFHLDMATRRNVERGLAPEAARRQARHAFGSTEAMKEEAREAHRARSAERVVWDVRFGLRSLRRSPAFTAAAVLTLALGIGASAAIYAVVNAVLLRPLPIPDPEDFRYVGWAWSERDFVSALTDFQYEFVRTHHRGFESVAAFRTQELHLGDDDRAQPIRGLRVTGGFFRTLGLSPRLGREFDADEFETEAPVVILSDEVWRARLGGDSAIMGRAVRFDGEPRTVVGILPREFRFPPAPEYAGYLAPLAVRGQPQAEGNNTEVIARLRHGTTDAARDAEVRGLSRAFRTAHPTLADSGYFRLFTHVESHVGPALKRTLWVLFGAISLVLLITCANTATLFLMRAAGRRREIAVRASIGAGPRRILQQLLTEGLVLTSIAGALGVLLGSIALRGFLAAAPSALPAGAEPGIDARVLLFAVGIVVGTGAAFGLAAGVPAFQARLHSVLLGGSHGSTAGHSRVRQSLLFVQSAVAVVLLAGAALLATSFARLVRVDPGFDADRVVAARLGRLPPEYDAARRDVLVDRLRERVRALPGVEHAALAPSLPLERGMNFPVDIPERPDLGMGGVQLRFVSPDYFATLGIPLRAGRDFGAGDVQGSEPVAIVNEAFARHFWQGATGVGRNIRVGHLQDRWRVPPQAQRLTRVIAVAADIHELGLDRPARPTVLLPRAQASQGTPLLLVRGTAPVLLGRLREEIVAEEPRLAPAVERLTSVVSRSVAAPRFRTVLVGGFAGFALLLAGIGIYGVIASAVQQRRREIALRLALGAGSSAVARSVALRCLVSVAGGMVVGLLGFWATRRVLTAWLYDLTPGDPRVLSGAVLVFVVVAGFAAWIPARRAARVDPATALRLE
jgi:predicted permease